MADYISREAVLALKHPIGAYGMDIESKAVEQIPAADVVEVVRCKDCKNFIENPNDCISGYGLTGPEPMDFCPYGERRTDNG